ncbi:MAG: glycosyltransferase family 39 protein [Planctomycetes bacterium]|nr:glycosyltransferase family 39 protein [Planctomycetota bacterium]
MKSERVYWASYAVLAIGFALRFALTVATPARLAYDDHFPPVEIIANEHRLPLPAECWECYQPPAYYMVAAAAFGLTENASKAVGSTDQIAAAHAKKAVQFLSTLAGCATLWFCLLILRIPSRRPPTVEALALGCAALLPQHIYMSAMVTNDAFTYLVATLAVFTFLRASSKNWPLGGYALSGALAGLAILCKAYSIMTAAALIGALLLRRNDKPIEPPRKKRDASTTQRSLLAPLFAFTAACLAVGIWPTVRNLAHYNKLHVDNFDMFQTAMQSQFPGTRDDIEFTTFRFPALVRHPWVHISQVNSFWTELYARYWFDYEGIPISLSVSREWRDHIRSLHITSSQRTREDWQRALSWRDGAVPAVLHTSAVASYFAGLPITLMLLLGWVVALGRLRASTPACIHALHVPACILVPLVQVWRLPFMSAMKAAFTLNAVASGPWLIAEALERVPAKARPIVSFLLGLGLLILVVANVAFIVYMAQRAA